MKSAIALALFLVLNQMPKNNPNGVWQAETGSKFNLQLSGSDLKVQIVEGSNPRYLEYELNLRNQEEVNTYSGKGYFVAKLQDGKVCRFDSEWQIVVVSSDRIIGSATNIIPVPGTCEIHEKALVQVDLKKVQ
jgi:hypothetical protein